MERLGTINQDSGWGSGTHDHADTIREVLRLLTACYQIQPIFNKHCFMSVHV